jgi:hypothetical protein
VEQGGGGQRGDAAGRPFREEALVKANVAARRVSGGPAVADPHGAGDARRGRGGAGRKFPFAFEEDEAGGKVAGDGGEARGGGGRGGAAGDDGVGERVEERARRIVPGGEGGGRVAAPRGGGREGGREEAVGVGKADEHGAD